MAENGGDRPVTRDGLDGALARLELRLVQQLASSERVTTLESRVLTVDAVREIVAVALRDSEARGWTSRERVMGFVLFLITVGSFVLNVYALKGGK